MKNLLLRIAFKALSDFYRIVAAILDWRCHLRVITGRPKYDVACITNFECDMQKNFMGFFSERKPVKNGMRFSIGKTTGRYLLINSTARDLLRSQTRDMGKTQTRIAVVTAIHDGAKVILLAAGTKRLFDDKELALMRADFPEMIFTIGDNGTAWALLCDIFHVIERRKISKGANVVVLGPNGYLGEVVMETLTASGFRNLIPISIKDPKPIDETQDVELVIACTHHHGLRLSADRLCRMASAKGISVVDVCKPANLSVQEFSKCGDICERQDSGTVTNDRLRYVFSLGAIFILHNLNLGLNRLYGCFAETLALGLNDEESRHTMDFLKVNRDAMSLVERIFAKEGFRVAPLSNFGKAIKVVAGEKEAITQRYGRRGKREASLPCSAIRAKKNEPL
jgi:hypothetical protein